MNAKSEMVAQDGAEGGQDVNLEVILDVPVTLSMEVGRTRIPIRNLLQLNQGSVVELDRAAGEPLDVFVNGTLVAHGEVVVVNEKFGIRITDVVSPAERIRKPQERKWRKRPCSLLPMPRPALARPAAPSK